MNPHLQTRRLRSLGAGIERAARAWGRVLALSIALVSTPLLAAGSDVAPAPPGTGGQAPVPAAAPAPVTLFDIVGEVARTAVMQREIAATLRDTADLSALTAALDLPPLAPGLQALAESRDPATRLRYTELQALEVPLRERARELNEATAALAYPTQKLVADLNRLDREAALWPQRADRARQWEAPPEVQRRVEAVGPELAALRKPLLERRDAFLVAYQRAVRMQAQLESMRTDLAERRERLRTVLRTDKRVPIWQETAERIPLDELRVNAGLVRFALVDYLRKHGERAAGPLVVLTVILFVFLRRPAAANAVHAGSQRLSLVTAACGALALALACTLPFAPPAPLILYRLAGLPLPLLAAVVATRGFAGTIPATVWTLAFAVSLNQFRALAEMSAVADWLLRVLQVVPFGIALAYDWRRGALARFLPRQPRVYLDGLIRGVIAMLAIVIVVGLLGYAGIAYGLVALTVIAPAYVLTFAALASALDGAAAGLLSTPLAQGLRSVRERRNVILLTLHRIAVLVAWMGGALLFALSFMTLDDVIRIATFIADTGVSAGDVTITLKAMLSALFVVAMTWAVTKLARFVLDHEILPRLRLRAGVPIAISTIVGYVLIVTGCILAMGALGIDLTKVTLLAGAVGIGVGSGLQNVVNNFASGLILMLERPINVGDEVDVGGMVGEVRRIGVRSSTIRTSQGAEVIVPNADLASKQVTNWTLSDRRRRYEIDIGVAYGSDPARVMRLLEAAAADVPEVLKEPAPRALFRGFGEKSLDFRLLAWVENVNVGSQAQNNLRMAILRVLDEAGIENPFAQRDVRIRYAASDPAAVVAPAPNK